MGLCCNGQRTAIQIQIHNPTDVVERNTLVVATLISENWNTSLERSQRILRILNEINGSPEEVSLPEATGFANIVGPEVLIGDRDWGIWLCPARKVTGEEVNNFVGNRDPHLEEEGFPIRFAIVVPIGVVHAAISECIPTDSYKIVQNLLKMLPKVRLQCSSIHTILLSCMIPARFELYCRTSSPQSNLRIRASPRTVFVN